MCSRDKNDQKSSETAVDRMHGWSTKRITYTGMFVAIAMVFSYLESMIPVNIAVPGIKLGLANMVTIVVMYRLRISDAWIVSLVRVALSSLLFGNMTVMVYSMAGAVLSLLVMTLCRKKDLFGLLGTSILGGVSHNAGQIAMAALLMKSGNIMLYMPVLCISGTIAGVCIGLAGAVLVRKLPSIEY
ncbi:heptaprenyl diphosphate synthase [Coprococcus sp. AF19-8AC]|jgi:heptaprenyl diphosphate synthase|uniref:Gx transporter family protein n=1 Tax=Coprococcus sp. AF19-8AC TaxID=2293090 RepID=UPI000E70D3E0|nr:Gx transporter family protein [Coprococcus sp. AF19-8AC]RJV48098.1 heptaprenyl diphosphate synthase [Coprococcus sp. AF19-8AC]